MTTRELHQTTRPEDLFGPVSGTPESRAAAKRRWHELALDLHPDRTSDPAAGSAFVAVAGLYRQWVQAADAGRTSAEPQVLMPGTRGTYRVGARHRKGSVSNAYRAVDDRGAEVILKFARRPAANHLLDGEATAYAALARLTAQHRWLRPYYPRLLDSFAQEDPATGVRRRVNVLTARTDGWYTLAEVGAAYPGGLDGRDWAWMHRRLLWTVAGAHLAGLTHGAILPANVLIHPERHGVNLVGWSFAGTDGLLPAVVSAESDLYPPEARPGSRFGPAGDVYMAHSLMLRTLGPRPDPALAGFATGCMSRRPADRPTAAELTGEFDRMLHRRYGERTFRPFFMPTH